MPVQHYVVNFLSSFLEVMFRIKTRQLTVSEIREIFSTRDTYAVIFSDGTQAQVDFETMNKIALTKDIWYNEPSYLIKVTEGEAQVLKQRVLESLKRRQDEKVRR
jgi:hypothetical protein